MLTGPAHQRGWARVEALIPLELRAPSAVHWKARVVIVFPMIYVIIGTGLAIVDVWMGAPTLALLIAMTVPVVAITPWLMIRTRSLSVPAHTFAAVCLALIAAAAFVQGTAEWRSLVWVGVLALYVMLMAGRRAGLAWLAAGIAVQVTVVAARSASLVFPEAELGPALPLDFAILASVAVVTVVLAYFYEGALQQTLAEQEKTAMELLAIREGLDRAQRLAHMGSYEIDDVAGTSRFSRGLCELFDVPYRRACEPGALALFYARHPDEDAARLTALVNELRASGKPFEADARAVVPGRGERIYHLKTTPRLDRSGRVIGRTGTIQDVTELRNATAELERARAHALEASRLKSRFLANMSHEIRTPMNAVLGLTSLVLETKLDAEQARQLETVRTAGLGLLALIDDILDLSKVESGKMSLERIEIDPATILENVAATVAPRAFEKGLELVLAADPSLDATRLGDPKRLTQILLNLAGNAVKFTETGRVILRGRAQASTLIFEIEDTGIGISAEAQQKIFEPFLQSDDSTTRRFGGTGLGLTIARELAGMMNGDIRVTSAPGEGSRFTVSVELEPAPAQRPVAPRAPQRVLLLHGEPASRAAERVLLESLCTGVEAPADRAALAPLLEGPAFDAVLIDRGTAADFAAELDAPALRDARRVWLVSPLERAAPHEAALQKPLRRKAVADLLAGRASSTTASARTRSGAVPSLSILLAEDNDVNALVAVGTLERAGHKVTRVDTGRRAVDTWSEHTFDVVLMDLQMPDLDGLSATREIRALEERRGGRVPIIALTANAMKGDEEVCLSAGMDGYLSKPVDPRLLRETVVRIGRAGP